MALKRRNSGALIVIDNKVIARSHNLTELLLMMLRLMPKCKPSTAAANHLGGKYLIGCTLLH
jgi:tRNA(adenine34) deaminase